MYHVRVYVRMYLYEYMYVCMYVGRVAQMRFSVRPDRPWGPPSLLEDGYRVFPRGKVRPGRAADHSPLLVPRSWKSTAIPLPMYHTGPVMGTCYLFFYVCTYVGLCMYVTVYVYLCV